MDPVTRQPGYYVEDRFPRQPFGLYRPSRDTSMLPRLVKPELEPNTIYVYDRQPPRMAPQARAPNYYPEKKWSREPPTVTKQPMSMVDGDVRDWTSSVTDCTNDINTCFASFFCPCCLQCWLSDKMDEGCITPVCLPGASMALRMKMRYSQNIVGSILGDCCMSVWCYPCVLSQMKREYDYLADEGMY